MLLISSPIPSICITPAPPEKNHPDPYSPFPSAEPDVDDDGYRANRLSLPPSADPSLWHSSPLRPADHPPRKGLDRDQFNSLLRASRGQKAKFGSQKVPDLRKELALKNQSPKQLERRSRFLSKVNESSCIATICIPEVTLESPGPTTAHRSVSPRGFESEYSTLKVAAEDSEDFVVVNSPANPGCDEQNQLAEKPLAGSKFPPAMSDKSRRTPPSLDEITVHLKPVPVSSKKDRSRSRLPGFLKAPSLPSGSTGTQIQTIPVRSLALNHEMFDTTFQQVNSPQHPEPRNLALESRRAVKPHTVDAVAGPTLHATRAATARDMIVIPGRRSSPPPGLGRHESTWISTAVKRCSAPAEMQHSGTRWF